MNGIEVLAEIQKNHLGVGAIMLSTLTAEGSEMTMRALELGAFDFILKPQSKNQTEGKKEIRAALEPILKAFARSKLSSSLIQSCRPNWCQRRHLSEKRLLRPNGSGTPHSSAQLLPRPNNLYGEESRKSSQ